MTSGDERFDGVLPGDFNGKVEERSDAHASLVPSLDPSQIPQSDDVREQVREYYGSILAGSDDLKTNAVCCTEERPPKYVLDVMPLIDDEIIARFYGCGSPIPPALEGCTVVDLGCGVGRDVFVLSKLVGPDGRVIGVDMTPSQLDVAKAHVASQTEKFGFSAPNVEFRCGYIEDLAALGIEDDSVDLVVSNCVINLTPFKDQVFREIWRVLKPGGELYFADVFCDRRMPDELRRDPVLRGECLGGAIYLDDFERLLAAIGFRTPLYASVDPIHVSDLALETKLGFTAFTSRTVRAIKAEGLEAAHEGYGQTATYLGTIPEMPRYFDLDRDIRLIKKRPVAISGNMAKTLEQSRYGRHFEISAPGVHRGRFDFRRAQDAVEARRGKRAVDGEYLDNALERLGRPSFYERVGTTQALTAPGGTGALKTMQVNVTYACNLACRHCYLECSPRREERMSRQTMEAVLAAFRTGGYQVLDITGGSPELHPDFPWFLAEAAKAADDVGGTVIVRSNLTLLADEERADLLDALAAAKAQVVASIPYYDPATMDAQRGAGTFKRAMEVIRRLNRRGYGLAEGKAREEVGALGFGAGPGLDDEVTGEAAAEPLAEAIAEPLTLDLVYNVSGPFLPPPQELLEDLYRAELAEREGIAFNHLYAFNNYPLGRFAHDLLDANMFDEYLDLLAENFNALAVQRMMCRDQVNVDFDGRVYDCEVNHVLGLPVEVTADDDTMRPLTVFDLAKQPIDERVVRTHPVCYSCAAGFGSSCGGALV